MSCFYLLMLFRILILFYLALFGIGFDTEYTEHLFRIGLRVKD
jgi:hypothetical protein